MNYDNIRTLEDFQLVLDEDPEILRPTDLLKKHKILYNRAQYLGYLDKLVYKNKVKRFFKLSKEELISFLKENKITSRSELKSKYPGAHHLLVSLEKHGDSSFLELLPYSFTSSYEKLFAEYLIYFGKLNFITQYPILDNGKILRYDFYLPEYNCLIEIHGEQHFREVMRVKNSTLEDIILRDKYRFNVATKNNIKIYYFSFSNKNDFLNYPFKVFNNVEELFVEIFETIPEVNPNYVEDKKLLTKYYPKSLKELLLKAQNSTDTLSIKTRESLRKQCPSLYYRLKKWKVLDDIKFFSEKEIDVRYINSVEEANLVLREKGIDTLFQLKKDYHGFYEKAVKYNWIDLLEFKLFDNVYVSTDNITLNQIKLFLEVNKKSISNLYRERREFFKAIKKNNWKNLL